MARFDRSIEDRLRELADAGGLSGLPGEGRPIAPEDLAGDDERWAAFRLMKNNKVIPAWFSYFKPGFHVVCSLIVMNFFVINGNYLRDISSK